MFLYRDILKKSLKISWQHKYLWFFGLFASLVGGSSNFRMSFSKVSEDWNENIFASFAHMIRSGVFGGGLFTNLARLFEKNPLSAVIFVVFSLIFIVLAMFLLWLAIVSQIGLISNSAKIIKSNGKDRKTTIKEGIEVGMRNFWPVLGFNLIIGAVIFFLAVFIGLPLIYITAKASTAVNLLYFLSFIVFVPFALILSFLLKYAICYIVIKKEKAIDSIGRAWKLFAKNWLISIEMALLLFFIDVLFIVATGVIILVMAIPYLFIAFGLASLVSINLFWIMFITGIIFAVILIILGGSMLTTFKLTAWTELFLQLSGKGGLSKIVRFAEGMKK